MHSPCDIMQEIICDCGQSMQFLNYIAIAGKNGLVEYEGMYQCDTCKTIKFIDTDYDEIYKDTYTEEYINDMKLLHEKINRDDKLFTFIFVGLIIALVLLIFGSI